MVAKANASAGHKLGQLIGDWFEEYFVFPILKNVSKKLRLYLDSRFIQRKARGDKIQWKDIDGNYVDYDFVMELDGNSSTIGIPVAFFECFWRRGARHSKDKARDDSGKLLPMFDAYPCARFLGIISAGDFTNPARELVKSRGIELFYISKDKIIKAFSDNGLNMDYLDRSSESEKAGITNKFESQFTKRKKQKVCDDLKRLLGATIIGSFTQRVHAKLSALPQEIRFILRHDSHPIIFDSVSEAAAFLSVPRFSMENPEKSYVYQITFSDGSEFERTVETLSELRELHDAMRKLTSHMESLIPL